MTTIEEARGIVRALVDDPHTSVDDVMIAVRAAMLQAHSDACTQCLYRSQGAERAECAGYRRIEELGR